MSPAKEKVTGPATPSRCWRVKPSTNTALEVARSNARLAAATSCGSPVAVRHQVLHAAARGEQFRVVVVDHFVGADHVLGFRLRVLHHQLHRAAQHQLDSRRSPRRCDTRPGPPGARPPPAPAAPAARTPPPADRRSAAAAPAGRADGRGRPGPAGVPRRAARRSLRRRGPRARVARISSAARPAMRPAPQPASAGGSGAASATGAAASEASAVGVFRGPVPPRRVCSEAAAAGVASSGAASAGAGCCGSAGAGAVCVATVSGRNSSAANSKAPASTAPQRPARRRSAATGAGRQRLSGCRTEVRVLSRPRRRGRRAGRSRYASRTRGPPAPAGRQPPARHPDRRPPAPGPRSSPPA